MINKIQHWLKTKQIKRFIRDHYDDHEGFKLAKAYQQSTNNHSAELTYGEICFHAYLHLLELLAPNHTHRFLELGSSIGKNCLITAMMTNADSVTGIEIIPSMYEKSLRALQNAKMHKTLSRYISKTKIQFIQGDFFEQDWQTFNMIFINGTAFIDAFWQKISTRLAELPEGTIIAVTSHPLDDSFFQLQHSELLLMSWGYANVFIYKKRKPHER